MPILKITTDVTGQVDVEPRTVRIDCTDSLFTITQPGYLSSAIAQGYTFKQTDVIFISYGPAAVVPGIFRINFALTNGTNIPTLQQTEVPYTTQDGITAHAGGGQTNAFALTTNWNRITTVATGNDSVILPGAVPGSMIVVANDAASNSANVYPAVGDAINALGTNNPFALAANKRVIFFCIAPFKWDSVLTA